MQAAQPSRKVSPNRSLVNRLLNCGIFSEKASATVGPATYFKKTYLMDQKTGICPVVAAGPTVADAFSEKIPQFNNLLTNERFGDTYAKVVPLASGKKLTLSPDDPKSLVSVESLTGQISLLDGRNLAPNGWLWFVS